MKEKNLKKQKQDAITNQVMLVFVAAAVLLWGVSYLYKMIDRGSTYGAGMAVSRVLCVLAAVAAVGTLVWFIILRKKGSLSETAVFHPGMLALFFAALSLCCGILCFSPMLGMRLIYVLVPSLAILYLIFKVYDRQFFTMCVTHGYALLALFLCYKLAAGSGLRLVGVISAAVLCLVPVVLLFLPEKNDVRHVLLGSEANKRFLLPLYVVTLGVLCAAFFLGGKSALVLLLAGVAYLVGAAIYFTVKLI